MGSDFTDRWQPKVSGSKKSGPQSSQLFRSGNQKASKNVSSFYVTKFLEYVTNCDLWRMCNRLGKVVDVFISNKKS